MDDLVDIVSKNGVLLLNIGPKPDGTIPDPSRRCCWTSASGWASTARRSTARARGISTARVRNKIGGGSFSDSAEYQFSPSDFRFTTKPNTVYAITLAWPEDGKLLVRSLPKSTAGTVTNVSLLGYNGKLRWTQDESGLSITLPTQKPCEYAYSLKITGKDLKGIVPVNTVQAPAEGDFSLKCIYATTHGDQVRCQTINGVSSIGYWDNANDWVSWTVKFPAAATYELSTKCSAMNGPSAFAVELGDRKLSVKVPQTKGWEDYVPIDIGKIEIKAAGTYQINMRSADPRNWQPINVQAILMTRQAE